MDGRVIPEIAELRLRLHKGLHHELEAVPIRCILFYYDMKTALRDCQIREISELNQLLEAFPVAAQVLFEYRELCEDKVNGDRFARLGVFGAIHCVTQIVETVAATCDILRRIERTTKDTERSMKRTVCRMKRKEYWKFRNRHSHLKTNSEARSTNDPEGFDLHVFTLPMTSLKTIHYKTKGPSGFMVRPANIPRLLMELQFDLEKAFVEILEAVDLLCRSLGDDAAATHPGATA